MEDVWRDLVSANLPTSASDPVDTTDYATAISHTHTRIALVTASDELRDILDSPFAAWRVYLHPSQHKVAYRASYSGPAQVSGGPGTGKTVVALHRVKHLPRRRPRPADDVHQRSRRRIAHRTRHAHRG